MDENILTRISRIQRIFSSACSALSVVNLFIFIGDSTALRATTNERKWEAHRPLDDKESRLRKLVKGRLFNWY